MNIYIYTLYVSTTSKMFQPIFVLSDVPFHCAVFRLGIVPCLCLQIWIRKFHQEGLALNNLLCIDATVDGRYPAPLDR